MSELIKLLSCPITGKIFRVPMIGSDNTVYEGEILFDMIENKKKSPVTDEILKKDVRVVITMKTFIDTLEEEVDSVKENRYVPKNDISKMYHFSKSDILSIFGSRKNYQRLLKYDEFVIEDMDSHLFVDMLKCATSDVIIHILDRLNNLEHTWSNWSIINYICRYAKEDIIIHMIKTYPTLDWNHPCQNSWRPIHQIAIKYSDTCVKEFLNLNVDLLEKNNECISGLEYILGNCTLVTVLFAISKVDFSKVDFIFDGNIGILFVRIEDNEKLSIDDKSHIIDTMFTKYSLK
jgi:hypothetical protein